MKRIAILVLAIVALSGCGRTEMVWNKVEGYFGGLDRKVTLYTCNGVEIKSWQTNNEIKYQGPAAAFIDKNGMNVRIAGTFVIEGK
jgi:uncharacterized lipoprotein YehR (DUF1307 family)